MNGNFLKTVRVVISCLAFALIVIIYSGFASLLPGAFTRSVLFLQFGPSLLGFTRAITFAASGFLFVLGLTFLFGRVYCSFLCPLGFLQDMVIGTRTRTGSPARREYRKPQPVTRYMILGIITLLFIGGNIFLFGLLDPFSLAGKILAGFNGVIRLKHMAWPALVFSGAVFLTMVFLAFFKDRWYCNTICPAGSILNLASKFSLFRISKDVSRCTQCGKCVEVCKADCIDHMKYRVDFDRCVACYNCIGVCEEGAVGYKSAVLSSQSSVPGSTTLSDEQATNATNPGWGGTSRRTFFKLAIAGTAGIAGAVAAGKLRAAGAASVGETMPVIPPGSVSIGHYTNRCTACHLCVSVCPTKVLQPSFLEFGLEGIFKPKMDFSSGYCRYGCNLCSEACPTGAIQRITKKEQENIRIGVARFTKNLCIPVFKKNACGLCAVHCPTKAIEMVPYLGDLFIPRIHENICTGCGACEFDCPVKPDKAIVVEGFAVQRRI
jgi:ferredoxin